MTCREYPLFVVVAQDRLGEQGRTAKPRAAWSGNLAPEEAVTPFDQSAAACRFEWSTAGHDHLAPAPVTIIVDVLSSSTCVEVAAGRGVAILPYDARSGSAEVFARDSHAELAGPRGVARYSLVIHVLFTCYSLSPASLLGAAPGGRCVLPSPNGAALAIRAATRPTVVIAGCLRNAAAVAHRAARLGSAFNVCAAGERWPDGSLRFAVEDWLGAGATLRHLTGLKSSEALAAMAAMPCHDFRRSSLSPVPVGNWPRVVRPRMSKSPLPSMSLDTFRVSTASLLSTIRRCCPTAAGRNPRASGRHLPSRWISTDKAAGTHIVR